MQPDSDHLNVKRSDVMRFRFVDTWVNPTTSLRFITNTFLSFVNTITVRKSARSTLTRKALALTCRTNGTISCIVYIVITRNLPTRSHDVDISTTTMKVVIWDGKLARSVIRLDETLTRMVTTNALLLIIQKLSATD